jgi:tetratricopeptide (TPR) repeat protein
MVLEQAYSTRGEAFLRAGDYDHAIDDVNSAIRLIHAKLNLFDAYRQRAAAYIEKGDDDRGIADDDRALQLAGSDADRGAIYRQRGFANFDMGRYTQATREFVLATQVIPKNAYGALGLQLAHWKTRSSIPVAFAREGAGFDLQTWPGPIIGLVVGKATPDEVLARAVRSDTPEHGNSCEASFYVAEYLLAHASRERARQLLRQAAISCPKGYFEYASARAELRKLGWLRENKPKSQRVPNLSARGAGPASSFRRASRQVQF